MITFDATGLVATGEPDRWTDTATGDLVGLTRFDVVPDLPAAPTDLARLRHGLAVRYSEAGCLIEANAVVVDGLPAVTTVIKLPGKGRAMRIMGSLIVPRDRCSAVLQIQADEQGTTGVREAMTALDLGAEMFTEARHPDAPGLKGRLPYLACDEARYDARFPDHPLSRARRWLDRIVPTVRVDPRIAALPPFDPQFDAPFERPAPDPSHASGGVPDTPRRAGTRRRWWPFR